MNFLHDGQPELLTKRTIIWLCVIVLAYSVCMFFRLGTVEIPQTCVRLNPGDMFSVTVDVQKISSCLVWSKYGGFTDSNNSANEHVVQSQLTFQVDGQVLGYIDTWHTKWIRCDLISSNHESSMLDIVYEGDHFFDLYEIAFLDDAQNLIPYQVEDKFSAICDEIDIVDKDQSILTAFSFDELLYADTVDHYFTDGPLLEGTHPPMGKNFILLGVLLFGHNTIGYRFMGALCGILTLFVMFFLVRRIVKKNNWALVATFLMCLDCLYYVQSRTCLIDIYTLCFILLSYLFMVRYVQTMRSSEEFVFLALSGICFGVACASKWIGCYAGVGLAIIFFVSFYQKLQYDLSYRGLRRWVFTLLWCCLWFVMVPVLIYILSYIPVLAIRSHSVGGFLRSVWANQVYMWDWHAHYSYKSFEWQSGWYGWPFNIGFLIYYGGAYVNTQFSGVGQVVLATGNTLLWVGGLVGVVLCFIWLIRHAIQAHVIYNDLLIIIVAYLCQYVPWWFINRPLFLYHYLCAGVLSIICLVVAFEKLWDKYQLGKFIVICYTISTAVWFVSVFPVLNGLPVSKDYLSLIFALIR